MAISVVFPTGSKVAMISPLYQWDKGHTLEIRIDTDLPQIEVHFSHRGLRESITGECSISQGVVRVTIPDECLGQPNMITAWVYETDGFGGKTTRTILIPIKPRTRPPRKAMEV